MVKSLTDRIFAEAKEKIVPSRVETAETHPLSSKQSPVPALPPEDVLGDTILGACLCDPVYCADALTRLREDDWSLGWQKAVWRAMVRLYKAGKPVNAVTLSALLDPYSRDLLNRACGERQNPYQQDYIGVAANWGAARRQLREAGEAAATALEMRE